LLELTQNRRAGRSIGAKHRRKHAIPTKTASRSVNEQSHLARLLI